MKKIETVDALKKAIASGHNECAILLVGNMRSSKYISYDGKKFDVSNYIDGTDQKLSEEELFDEGISNIGRTMKAGTFVLLTNRNGL